MQWPMLVGSTNLFLAGILAGVETATNLGSVTGADFLTEGDQIRLRRALILRLRVLVPATFAPMFLSTITVAALSVPGAALMLRGMALLCDAFWIYARVFATIRINSATVDWDPTSPPVDWSHLVGRAERFHRASMWGVIAGFGCLVCADAIAV